MMKITLEENKDGVTRVYCGEKFSGVIRFHNGQLLCYSNKRHTTADSLNEVIKFFNGYYQSYYYKGKER